MRTLGLCIGASSITAVSVEMENNNIDIKETISIPHEGSPKDTIKRIMNSEISAGIDRFAVTGRKLRHMLKASSISEPEALEHAYKLVYNRINEKEKLKSNIIVSAGGETFMVYQVDSYGKIVDVFTGNKCASGTGEFFLQQLKRMDIDIEEAILKADRENPYKVAGRCSVFCKSDCTHALNKGASKESVVAGLCEMMATKIIELLKKVESDNILVVGGTSENQVMIDYLRKKGKTVVIPPYAKCFEALGAALWAVEHDANINENADELFVQGKCGFNFLPRLSDHTDKVTFKSIDFKKARKDGSCIIGLDVGSTTTKAVLMREEDNAILASCYLRTNGDPVGAARRCYIELDSQIEKEINIRGLGVTGSGRQIAGLHALTPAVINEIIAHATAAAYFDEEVDTIFEIGGQDAKYTYLTNGVPSDYAMNEACSAGTGSFLEESAKESLNIDTIEIGEIALKGSNPPNFNDQCAAFIGSDIKSAIQMGLEVPDIAAGLVYSICMNYINRVKSSRAIGRKIFMQGGVCYNKAVPVAMAVLTGKEIIVPPEPGLMGAMGVALETQKRIKLGLLSPMSFELKQLAEREVQYKEAFVCAGGKEKCDRKCSINRIVIEGSTYPFGGACNKYYNLLKEDNKKAADIDYSNMDLVSLREKLLFEQYGRNRGKSLTDSKHKTIGINNSLLTNSLYPLYHNFFTALGYEVVLGEMDSSGMERKGSAFCFPVEIAHGTLSGLIKKSPDVYFLPHIKALPGHEAEDASVTCPFVQAEPYYLKTAFAELKDKLVLSPVFDFTRGFANEKSTFIKIGKKLGCSQGISEQAFDYAVEAQLDYLKECKAIGKSFMQELEKNPEEIALVLFGRPYNAYAKLANMGIPQKFSSRGYKIIPFDFLPFDNDVRLDNMYWALGQLILKGSKLVKEHKQLFGVYITNFSCGPDSFLVGYFRREMGQKPSLTLELDSHTADAGIDTRVEAFLDVVKSYIEINRNEAAISRNEFRPAYIKSENGKTMVIDSKGKEYPLNHPKVHMLVPSMGDAGAKLLAAVMRHVGINATALPAPKEMELKIGRGYSSCKECLPLILTVGSLLNYVENRESTDEVMVYFMPETSGPCRFGQYSVHMRNVIKELKIENAATLSLTSENGYAGFGTKFALRAWQCIIIADVLEEIYSAVLVLSKNREEALKIYREACDMIIEGVEKHSWKQLLTTIKKAALKLSRIERISNIESTPKAALVGEIYVRRDDFSRQNIVEKLADKGIIVKTAPVAEWIYYCDYIVKNKLVVKSKPIDRLRTHIQGYFKNPFERIIKEAFAVSGFYELHLLDVDRIVENVADLVSPRLTGETILTVGSAITEVVEEVDGVIAIGPFGCMPGRIAEAVISAKINEKKRITAKDTELVQKVMEHYPSLPFLSIETDGNVFPQIIEARLETFCLQLERVHKRILEVKRI